MTEQDELIEEITGEETGQEESYVQQLDDEGIEQKRRDRRRRIQNGITTLLDRSFMPKKDVRLGDLKGFCRDLMKEAESQTVDEVGLRREVRRLLAFDTNLRYYGCDDKGQHHFFRIAESLDKAGIQCLPGWVRLHVDGSVTEHPGEHIPHEEMVALTMRPFADRRIPAAVTYLISRKCTYLGYSSRTEHHFLWQPSVDERGAPIKRLVMLRILKDHPGKVLTQGQFANLKVVLGPGTSWIPKLWKEGKLAETGPLYLDSPAEQGNPNAE